MNPCRVGECLNLARTRGLCNKHYQRWWNTGTTDPGPRRRYESNEDRLDSIGWTVTDTDCWEVSTYREKFGYGRIRVSGKNVAAHRLAYETWVGPIPKGHVVRHKCDNPPCINPEHLETGTNADNSRDRIERGRTTLGEKHHSSKLSREQVLVIREKYQSGEKTQTELAQMYRVNVSSISKIIRGVSWKNV